MNIEELNSCFDSVTPTKEQRERILAGVMSAKNQPVKVVHFHRYATAVAAVFVIGIFALVYPQISKNTLPAKVDNPTVAMIPQKEVDTTEEILEKENTVESKVEESAPVMRNKSLSDDIKATYPETVDGTGEDTMVAVNESSVNSRNVKETSGDVEIASFGGDADNVAENMIYSEIMSHEVYSKYVPEYFAGGYALVSAEKYQDGSMQMFFVNADNKKMYVSVIAGEFNNPENVIIPEDILNFERTICIGFAVKCNDYYVYYNIDEGTKEDIYEE